MNVNTKRWIQVLAIGCWVVVGNPWIGCAELVERQPDSIFDVDGLMVDSSEPEANPVETNKVFSAGIRHYPLIEARKPLMAPQPSRIRSPIEASGLSQGVVQTHIQAADTYAKSQNWPQALAEIQQALELDAGNLYLLQKAAAFAALARKFGVADEYFQRVLTANPESLPFLTGRAGVLIRLLRLKEADELVRRALVIDPSFLAARFDRLCIQIARGDSDLSVEGWDILNTEDIVQLSNWLDADRQDYVKALNPEGYSKLCAIVLGSGTDTRVTEIVGLLRKASIASAAGQWNVAEETLKKVKNTGVRATGLDVDIGRCLFQKGNRNAALANFKALAEQHPGSSSILYDYAYVLINMELYAESAQVLEKVCALNPQDGQAAFALACSYASLGKMDVAWPLLTRLAGSHPNEIMNWVIGDQPYQRAIQKDPRYAEFEKSLNKGPTRNR